MAAVVVAMHMQKKKHGAAGGHHAQHVHGAGHEGHHEDHTGPHSEDPTLKEDYTARMQRWFRAKILYNMRLDRKKLAERLYFEKAMVIGLFRLINQVCVFGLFVSALRMSSNESVKRGIHHNLRDIYDFDAFSEVKNRNQFFSETMTSIAAESKQFFVKSSDYFSDAEGSGATQLLGEITSFANPKVGAPFQIKVREFTLTAWVKLSSTFVQGFILQKRPPGTTDPELSCWGWHLHSTYGPQLKYGAHNFYPLDVNSDGRQATTQLEEEMEMKADQFMLLTLTVSENMATFWENGVSVGQAPLSFPISECYDKGHGLFIGAGGMEIGALRFYPRILSTTAIFELFESGDTLEDISSGSGPRKVETSELDTVGNSLAEAISSVESHVAQRQILSEISAILNILETNPPSTSQTPDAPLGSISINQTRMTATDSGSREYYSIFHGPGKLTRTTSDFREFSNFPSWSGTGATFSFWYRHDLEPATTGMYLFYATSATANGIWSLWIEENAIWLDNQNGNPTNHYPRNLMQELYTLRDKNVWRHLALRLDETNDKVTFFVDGEKVFGPTDWNGAVSQVDTGRNQVTFGRLNPAYLYGSPVEVYDFRFYIHNQGQTTPPTDMEIKAIADAHHPVLSGARCLSSTSVELQDNGGWTDSFGHSCDWFALNSVQYPQLCQYGPAARNCKTACKSAQPCLTTETYTDDAYFVWDSIQRIEARVSEGDNQGTICLGNHLTKAAVVEECQNWVNGGNSGTSDPRAAAWLDSWSRDGRERAGKRLDLSACDTLEASIDEYCAFDSSQVKSFTEKMTESGGDYTIGFWTKPTGITSLDDFGGEDRFIPHVNLYSALSPPAPQVIWGQWSNPNGESRAFTSCQPSVPLQFQYFENVELKEVSSDGWSFITFSRKNSTDLADFIGEWYGGTNLASNSEGSKMTQCLFDPEYFFSSMEINYPSLISPILMVPKSVPFFQMQQLYLNLKGSMDLKLGPLDAQKDRIANSKVNIEKGDFFLRTTLMAPPLLFQMRTRPSPKCAFNYSDWFVQQNFQEVKQAKCAHPYECEEEVLSRPELTLACPGDRREDSNEIQFGLPLQEFAGKKGFADFLQSVTENPFLYRDGAVTPTADFIDSSTEYAEITLVFYTPRAGVTTVMVVSADFSGDQTAGIGVQLRHYEILEGTDLTLYLVVQSLIIVNVAIMGFDIIFGAKDMFLDFFRDQTWPSVSDSLKLLTDLCTATMVVIYIGFRIPLVSGSADKTEEVIGGLSSIPWNDPEMEVSAKKSQFFTKTNDLLELTQYEYDLSVFCNIILLVSLMRVIQCTSLHPRLALLTGTLNKALDDIGHAAILIGLLMGCFAVIATWRFGSERDDFGTLNASMETQFEMMFGEFPEDWNESFAMILYTIFYIMIVFLLVQNFLLAIIVEAYMNVRQDNEDLETEQAFPPDAVDSVYSYAQYILGYWPSPGDLAYRVEEWEARYSIGFNDLFMTGLFNSQEQTGRYLKYYAQYEFLEPRVIESYPPSAKGQELVDQIEFRLARRLGKPVPTLNKLLQQSIEYTANKKQERGLRRLSEIEITNSTAGNNLPKHADEGNKSNGFSEAPTNGKDGLRQNGNGHNHNLPGEVEYQIRIPTPEVVATAVAQPAIHKPAVDDQGAELFKMLRRQEQAMKMMMHDNVKQRKDIDQILKNLGGHSLGGQRSVSTEQAYGSLYQSGSSLQGYSAPAAQGDGTSSVLGILGFSSTSPEHSHEEAPWNGDSNTRNVPSVLKGYSSLVAPSANIRD